LTLGVSAYVFTTLAGALAIDRSRRIIDDPLTERDEARQRRERRAYGRALLVPGIGPAVAIARADTAMRAWGAGMAGLTQAVSVGLVIVGMHRLARARRLERLSFSAMGTAQEAHVAMRVRF
jgi:orotidine-5'-phosphate decarboxylase